MSWNQTETGSFNQEYADQSQSAMIHQIDCLLDQSTTEISPSSRSFYREFNNGGFSSNQSTSGEYQNGTLPYSYPAHDHPKLVTNHTTAGTNESQGTHFFDEQFDPYNTLESIWDLRNPTYYGIPSHSNTNGLSLNSNIVHESYLNQTRTLEGPEDFIQSRQPSTSAFVQKTFEPERSPQEINFPFVNTEAYEEVLSAEIHSSSEYESSLFFDTVTTVDNPPQGCDNFEPFQVDLHAMRDPRKKFLSEYFKKHYQH